MEGVQNLSQQGLWFPILLILVFYIPVSEQIVENCGSGAVVGQPYTMECTNIPETVNNGINVFLGDTNMISCFTSKNCASLNTSLYSVMTPHNESLFFTILDVTTDDIGKKLYCVDDSTLDPTSQPSCPLALVQTTEIVENCRSGAVVGQPYNIECSNISDTVNNGMTVFLGDKSIIICNKSKTCVSQDTSRYSVGSPHNESLFFTILDVKTDDIGKKIYCVDDTSLDLSTSTESKVNGTSESSCPLKCNDCSFVLSDGAIAGIVCGGAGGCVVVGAVGFVIYRKYKGPVEEEEVEGETIDPKITK